MFVASIDMETGIMRRYKRHTTEIPIFTGTDSARMMRVVKAVHLGSAVLTPWAELDKAGRYIPIQAVEAFRVEGLR